MELAEPPMFQIVMDPMRALASLEFVSARGLDTADQGPSILANQVDNGDDDGCVDDDGCGDDDGRVDDDNDDDDKQEG